MKFIGLFVTALIFSACNVMHKPIEPTYNQLELKSLNEKLNKGENPLAEDSNEPTGDTQQASLWAKSAGNPYIIRNQKAQKTGDLLTVLIDEDATASTSANTNAKRENSIDNSATLDAGQGASAQLGTLGFSTSAKSELKGTGTTDHSGRFKASVQASVERVLPNGTLFVRGTKVVTINFEDQQIVISGFVRPDDIRIDNTVVSSMLADAEIRYVGQGVVSDKQNSGWGTRLLDAVWPF